MTIIFKENSGCSGNVGYAKITIEKRQKSFTVKASQYYKEKSLKDITDWVLPVKLDASSFYEQSGDKGLANTYLAPG